MSTLLKSISTSAPNVTATSRKRHWKRCWVFVTPPPRLTDGLKNGDEKGCEKREMQRNLASGVFYRTFKQTTALLIKLWLADGWLRRLLWLQVDEQQQLVAFFAGRERWWRWQRFFFWYIALSLSRHVLFCMQIFFIIMLWVVKKKQVFFAI